MYLKHFILFCIAVPNILFSQIQNTSYNALNLHSSSMIMSMGGDLNSIVNNDVSLALITPSLLNESMDKHISFNFVDYVTDINFISFHYASKLNDNLMFFSGIDAVNYGQFEARDEIGNFVSKFGASQQIVTIGVSKYLGNNFTLGSNLKMLNSSLESYHSLTLSSNTSITYFDKDYEFSSTLLFKNFGKPIINYTSQNEELPFEIQLGLSKSLKHLPFRYSFVFHHLNVYNLSNNYNQNLIYDPVVNQLIVKNETVAKHLLRHVILGAELNPFSKSLFIRAGFNFNRREDLKMDSFFNMSGFSWGLGISVKKVTLNYSRSAFHTSSMLNSFSVITNFSNFGM